ncbi:MAG: class I SAM-dependent methyltransferase [Cyanobacteria bacterium HKST-UBA02]|nr:class I SAM-dependent methyltransferase [Cyanobacteria bacterium HKST-UBA02]
MQSNFETALRNHMEGQRERLTAEQLEQYTRFALSNRDRGETFVEFLLSSFELDFSQLRVLDIGSAYGGFLIQSAKRGSICCGVEIVDYLHRLAEENIEGENLPVKLICGDFLDERLKDELGSDPFDVIVINDVFEHVFDLDLLIERINQHRSTGTFLYFSIPNGTSYSMVLKEGHKFIFGLSLLEPGLWAKLVGPFNIYYRPYRVYQFYFRHMGLQHIYLQVDPSKIEKAPARVVEKLSAIREEMERNPFESSDIANMAEKKIVLLEQQIKRDLEMLEPLDIHVLYEMHFWTGFATPTAVEVKDGSNLVKYELGSRKYDNL